MIRRSQVILAVIALIGFALAALNPVGADLQSVGVVVWWVAGLVCAFRFADKRVGFSAVDY